MPLNDIQIRALRPDPGTTKAKLVTVDRGLLLAVQPSGTKTFKCRYTIEGKLSEIALGTYGRGDGLMTLAEAKLAVQQVRADVRMGKHPRRDRTDARAARLQANGRVFEVMARQWHEDMVRDVWRPGKAYAHQTLRRLEKWVFPAIGSKPIDEVTRDDIFDLLTACRRVSGGNTAEKTRQHIFACFDEWLDRRLAGISSNPAAPAKSRRHRTLTHRKQPQPAALTIDDARRVLATTNERGSPVLRLMHRFQALTSVRPSEAREAAWGEIAGDVWRIPGSRTKQGRPHLVYLSRQAIEVLTVARSLARPKARLVFPSPHRGRRPESAMGPSSLARILNDELGKRVHVPHGWRAAFNTEMKRRHPQHRDLLQAMLAHVTKGHVEERYDRTMLEDFEPAARALWQEWADLLLEGAPSAWALVGLPDPVRDSSVIKLAKEAA